VALEGGELAGNVDGDGLPGALDDAAALRVAGDAGFVLDAEGAEDAGDGGIEGLVFLAAAVVGVVDQGHAVLLHGPAQGVADGDAVFGE
jgi:hypothetical protein